MTNAHDVTDRYHHRDSPQEQQPSRLPTMDDDSHKSRRSLHHQRSRDGVMTPTMPTSMWASQQPIYLVNDRDKPAVDDNDNDHDGGGGTIISYESFHAPLHEQQLEQRHSSSLPVVLGLNDEEGAGVRASRFWNSLRYYAFSQPIRLRQCRTHTTLAFGCHPHDDIDDQPDRDPSRRTNMWLALSFVLLVAGAFLLQSPVSSSSSGNASRWAQWFATNSNHQLPSSIHVAFVGNSMLYYNDVPRLLSQLSAHQLTQQSCLHGDATFTSILKSGNGMLHIWDTGNARVYNNGSTTTIHDYGACTVPQLLLGFDETLDARVLNNNNNHNNEYATDVDDAATYDDGKNPCLSDAYYYDWLQQEMVNTYGLYNRSESESGNDDTVDDDSSNNNGRRPNVPSYDFVVLNDNTRSPARVDTRRASLTALNETYLPMLRHMKTATPVFMATYGYSTPYRDMGGLGTVAVFTSLTHYGYQVYADSLRPYLPKSRTPRVAPIGIAFLVVWEENFSLWQKLFHVDQIHASPLGTYLQTCVLYHTIYGRMPLPNVALRSDMSGLWHDARRFQPGTHRTDSFPTLDEARYLYHVAFKVSNGYKPSSFLVFEHGEAAEYTPQDDLYRVDDLF